jgi:hypothetical protein
MVLDVFESSIANNKSKPSLHFFSCSKHSLHFAPPKIQKKRGDTRIELATSRTLSENHTTRPITLSCVTRSYKSLILCVVRSDGVVGYHVCFTRTRSRVRSSFRVLFFSFYSIHRRKFGRVVKAVALGAILVRGRGSNPLACIIFWPFTFGRKKQKVVHPVGIEPTPSEMTTT